MTPHLFATAAIFTLAGCTSLGGTVRGDFTCRAVEGTCAPLAVNDEGALAVMARDIPATVGRVRATANGATRAGERLLAVVLPAHIDEEGVLHDAATVHVVVEPAHWQPVATAADALSSTAFSRSLPPSLRGIITGVPAPVVEGPGFLPSRVPQPFPPAAALDAARAGHRILRPELSDALPVRASPAGPVPAVSAPLPVRSMGAAPLAAPTTSGGPK